MNSRGHNCGEKTGKCPAQRLHPCFGRSKCALARAFSVPLVGASDLAHDVYIGVEPSTLKMGCACGDGGWRAGARGGGWSDGGCARGGVYGGGGSWEELTRVGLQMSRMARTDPVRNNVTPRVRHLPSSMHRSVAGAQASNDWGTELS